MSSAWKGCSISSTLSRRSTGRSSRASSSVQPSFASTRTGRSVTLRIASSRAQVLAAADLDLEQAIAGRDSGVRSLHRALDGVDRERERRRRRARTETQEPPGRLTADSCRPDRAALLRARRARPPAAVARGRGAPRSPRGRTDRRRSAGLPARATRTRSRASRRSGRTGSPHRGRQARRRAIESDDVVDVPGVARDRERLRQGQRARLRTQLHGARL